MSIYSYIENGYIINIIDYKHFISRKVVINMPNHDKTGPEGLGPKTGRGLGSCASTNSARAGGGTGRGLGSGRGLGRGRGMGLRRNANTEEL